MTTQEPYSSNPFRTLGLRSNATVKEAGRCVDRLLKWIELGETPQVEDLFSYFGSLRRDRDEIKKASKEIEDPRARIRSELYWPSAELSVFEPCQEYLKAGRFREFVDLCEKAVVDGLAERRNSKSVDPRVDGCLAGHFLAVFYHSSAIVASRSSGQPTSGQKLPSDWDKAFRYWKLVIQEDLFWRRLTKRALALSDPRVDEAFVEQLRRDLPLTLLQPNVSRAVVSIERDRLAEFVLNCRIIKDARLETAGQQSLRDIVVPLQTRFEKSAKEIRQAVSEISIKANVPRVMPAAGGTESEPAFHPQRLIAYLGDVETLIKTKLVPIGAAIKEAGLDDDAETTHEIMDGVAYAYRSISLAFHNLGGMTHAALRLTALAKEFARGQQCKDRLDEDYQTLKLLALQHDAGELATVYRYKDSLAKLEEAKQFASTDEEKQKIDEWIELARKRLVLDGIKSIDTAPSMTTVNGIGARIYGKRDYDPDSQSYIATHYFTFFFVPIIPLGSYRVRDVGGGRYRFLGKVPMKRTAFIAPAIVAALVVAVIGISNFQDTGSNSTSRPVQSAPRSATSGPPLNSDSSRAWIDRERTRLDRVEAQIDSEGAQIKLEHQLLDHKFAELNSRSPSQEEINAYKSAQQQFNERVEIFNVKLEKYKADVESFNAQVNRYNASR